MHGKHKLFFVGMLSLCLATGCGERTDQKKSATAEIKIGAVPLSDNLNISAAQCKPLTPNDLVIPIVKAVQWIDPSHVEIKADGIMNCATSSVRGAHAVAGNRLELGYEEEIKGGIATACLCKIELTYSISGLDRKDYEIAIESMHERKDAWKARVKR